MTLDRMIRSCLGLYMDVYVVAGVQWRYWLPVFNYFYFVTVTGYTETSKDGSTRQWDSFKHVGFLLLAFNRLSEKKCWNQY